MSAKTVVCSICNKTVLKSQTVCIDPNSNPPKRACKIHEDAIAKQNILKENERKRIQQMTAPKPQRKSYLQRHDEEMAQISDDISKGLHRCWCCGEEVIHAKDYYYQIWMLSVLNKEISMFDTGWGEFVKKYFITKYGVMPGISHMVKSSDITNIKGKMKYRDLRSFSDYSPICESCLKIHKHEHLIPKLPSLNSKQLSNWVVVSEIAGEKLREDFKKFKKEYEDENNNS